MEFKLPKYVQVTQIGILITLLYFAFMKIEGFEVELFAGIVALVLGKFAYRIWLNRKYEIKNRTLHISDRKNNLSIPISSIKKINRHQTLISGSKVGVGLTFQYFIEFNDAEIELDNTYKNQNGKGIIDVLTKQYNKNFYDTAGRQRKQS